MCANHFHIVAFRNHHGVRTAKSIAADPDGCGVSLNDRAIDRTKPHATQYLSSQSLQTLAMNPRKRSSRIHHRDNLFRLLGSAWIPHSQFGAEGTHNLATFQRLSYLLYLVKLQLHRG